MKFPEYKHEAIEPQILEFWKKNKIVETLKKKNKDGKKFYFLQGPPYTSGRVHLGTAWDTVLKDMALRYKRSQGFNVWDRNGYDVHGLPTEHKVMAKYKLSTKEDILEFGIDKFVNECINFSLEQGNQMTVDFQRMGCTLDYSDSYMALKGDYMEGEWWMVKQAWKKNRLYLGEKVMTWCANCETALAKHECEYHNAMDNSIFLKFKVKKTNDGKNEKDEKSGKKGSPEKSGKNGKNEKGGNNEMDEYLVIWTTTPWTIPYNLGVMVNPELEYVKAEVDGEVWILGKGLAAPFIQSVLNKKLKIIETLKGEELLGTEYEHPFADKVPQYKELKKKHPRVHTVVLSSQYVDFSAGTGLVHTAPGCGPEDYEVGREYDIPPFNTLSEKGELMGMPAFAGRVARKDDPKFIEDLKKTGALVATTDVEHEYPYCWRCHKGVVFRTTKQWFFRIEDLRERMIAENQNVRWIPKVTQAFDSWTAHLKDNSVTRQRFWGTPVPIWKCDKCEEVEVIGSFDELKKKAKKLPKDLHKPWIDDVKWECSKCNAKEKGTEKGNGKEKDQEKGKEKGKETGPAKGMMVRTPDILDVWIDAGTASWNCLYYPQQKKYFEEYFPADFILEATEQVRLWFSMLSICSQLAFDKNCYRNVYMHGMLNDIEGRKMSKSLGNIISPYELIDKYGADGLRYYMCQTNAGKDINFIWDECSTKARYLHILWNIHKLLVNLAKENHENPFKLKAKQLDKQLGVEERYIFSELNSTAKQVAELFDAYRLDETIALLEELFLELSRTYIQMVRDKSSLGSEEEKKACLYTIANVLLDSLKMFSIVAPFICEAIYLNLKEEFKLKEDSITHYPFPKADGKKIDAELEQQMGIAQDVIQAALGAREKAKLGLRWPIKELVVSSKNEDVIKAVEKLREIILYQTNAKSLTILESLPGIKAKVKPDYGRIGPEYGSLSAEIIAKLSVDSSETILTHLEQEGSYQFTIGGRKIIIKRDMLIIEREVPEPYKEAELKNGLVYVNAERTDELEAEGYVRELMRNIQSLRKKAGLQKLDSINLYIKSSREMKPLLEKFASEIKEKVGARKLEISSFAAVPASKKCLALEEFKVKSEKFMIGLEKV